MDGTKEQVGLYIVAKGAKSSFAELTIFDLRDIRVWRVGENGNDIFGGFEQISS